MNMLVVSGGHPTASQTFVSREIAEMSHRDINVMVLAANQGYAAGAQLEQELGNDPANIVLCSARCLGRRYRF